MAGTSATARRSKLLASCLTAIVIASPGTARGAGPRKTSPYQPVKVTHRAALYYAGAWGVDRLKVSSTASGNLIRFSYRVVEPGLAKALSDRNATPQMFAQRTGALLQIPVMEKVGPLRQKGSAKPGQEYWMTFSNSRHLVRPGDRVDVRIGAFHAEGLVVGS